MPARIIQNMDQAALSWWERHERLHHAEMLAYADNSHVSLNAVLVYEKSLMELEQRLWARGFDVMKVRSHAYYVFTRTQAAKG